MDTPIFAITIGRQFGSGGREIGQYIARSLNIAYFDKELFEAAAKNSGMCAEFFESADEKSPSFFDNFLLGGYSYGAMSSSSCFFGTTPISHNNIHMMQNKVIKDIASQGSCVIVGRSADFVLRNYPNIISIFIHASMDSRVKRIMARHDSMTESEAQQLALKKDKLRASYYNYYTDKKWGDARSYDLSIDSSSLPLEDIGNVILDYIRLRLRDTTI